MTEKYISIQKLEGGFIVEYNNATGDDTRKIVRKLSELVSIVKEQMTEPELITE